jgi:hypothetical protein
MRVFDDAAAGLLGKAAVKAPKYAMKAAGAAIMYGAEFDW